MLVSSQKNSTKQQLIVQADKEMDRLKAKINQIDMQLYKVVERDEHQEAKRLAVMLPPLRRRIHELGCYIHSMKTYASRLEDDNYGVQCQCGLFVKNDHLCAECESPICQLHSQRQEDGQIWEHPRLCLKCHPRPF